MMTEPIPKPNTTPTPYPVRTDFQLKPSIKPESSSSSEEWERSGDSTWGTSSPAQFFDKGNPYNPSFPMNESFPKFWNCGPPGIQPVNWLWERFNFERKCRVDSCVGIVPMSWFEDKSSDSRTDRFSNEVGISPANLLFENFSCRTEIRLPTELGVFPSKLLDERSIVFHVVKILTSSNSVPLLTTMVEAV